MINISYLINDKYTDKAVRYEKQFIEGTNIQEEKQKLIDSGASSLRIKITDECVRSFDERI